METGIRSARGDDIAGIVEWTSDTFDWGDYVPNRLSVWIDQSDSEVMVCTDDTDTPIALVHAVMLSPTEGWLEAARVQPGHRREGLGSALNHAGVAWAKARGARVVRLATEAENGAARSQVETLGYRQTSSWVYAELEVRSNDRASKGRRLRPAPVSDVDPAWMFWSTSELAHGGRGFIAIGWQWRKASPDDLTRAASEGHFFQSPAGWVFADQPEEQSTRTIWLATTKEDAPRLFEGLIGLAANRGSTSLTVKTPNLPWATESIIRAGGDPKEILIYSKPVL